MARVYVLYHHLLLRPSCIVTNLYDNNRRDQLKLSSTLINTLLLIWMHSWITCKFLLWQYLVMIGEVSLLGALHNSILIVWKQVHMKSIITFLSSHSHHHYDHVVGSFCTPYLVPNTEPITLQQFVEKLPNFTYQLYLVSPKAEEEINAHVSFFSAHLT